MCAEGSEACSRQSHSQITARTSCSPILVPYLPPPPPPPPPPTPGQIPRFSSPTVSPLQVSQPVPPYPSPLSLPLRQYRHYPTHHPSRPFLTNAFGPAQNATHSPSHCAAVVWASGSWAGDTGEPSKSGNATLNAKSSECFNFFLLLLSLPSLLNHLFTLSFRSLSHSLSHTHTVSLSLS